ncbi:MAG TPA: hypothetical protein VEY12_03675 [Thermoplasmata archaeon]|nr:hypothetical protein [Thermoplasmata archaeon]
MKTAILVALAALAVVGLGVGIVAAQAASAPHATNGGMQGGYNGGMMGGSHGGMMGGQYGGGMMGNGGCGCANAQYCQNYMNDHNYSWNHTYGGMMG